MAAIRAVVVASSGERLSFKWFAGTSTDTVLASVRCAFRTPPDARFSLSRQSGEALDDLTELDAAGGFDRGDEELLLEVEVPPAEAIQQDGFTATPAHRPPRPPLLPSASTTVTNVTAVTEATADEERRPLLSGILPSPRLSLPLFLWGARRSSSLRQEPLPADEEAMQKSWLKLKRILAHLANERTYLAWLRVASKVFTVALLCATLSAKGSEYRVAYAVIGGVYIALCPQIVLLASRRYARAKEAMAGSVHDCYDSFRDSDVREVGLALAALVAATFLLLLLAQLD